MTNIFLLRYIPANEDFFTAALEYLLNEVPELGQEIVDYICQDSVQKGLKFKKAIDHPSLGDPKNKPDLLLQCEGGNIICEHKLESNLGANQLERYLGLAKLQEIPTHLALISNKNHLVPDAILESEQYLKLSGRKHFLWQDIYPIVANHPHRLAQHFKQLMAEFGMVQHTPIAGWENLFDPGFDQYQIFRNTLKDSIRPHFRQLGASCAMDGEGRWAYRIKYPQEAPWLHLMYVYAKAENKSPEFHWERPSLNATIWLLQDNPQAKAFYNHQEKFQSTQKRTIIFESHQGNGSTMRLKDGEFAKTFSTYYTDLSTILSTDLKATQSAILDFTTAVYEHAKEIVNSF
jgi:hypothetical protein